MALQDQCGQLRGGVYSPGDPPYSQSACLHCGDGRSFFVERYDDEDTAGNDCKSVYFESETGVNRALLKTLGGERGDR